MAEQRTVLPAPPSARGEYLGAQRPSRRPDEQVHRAWSVLRDWEEADGFLLFFFLIKLLYRELKMRLKTGDSGDWVSDFYNVLNNT